MSESNLTLTRVQNGIGLVLSMIPEELWREALAEAFDAIRTSVEASETKVDDLVLPLLKSLRKGLDLPDYD